MSLFSLIFACYAGFSPLRRRHDAARYAAIARHAGHALPARYVAATYAITLMSCLLLGIHATLYAIIFIFLLLPLFAADAFRRFDILR